MGITNEVTNIKTEVIKNGKTPLISTVVKKGLEIVKSKMKADQE
jgi:hypothetical protein